MNRCGECDVCCNEHVKIDVLNKPFGQKCSFYCNGCSQYESRPDDCKNYQCVFITQENLDVKYRPDNLGVVFEQPYGKSYWVGIELIENSLNKEDCIRLVRAMNNDGSKVMLKYVSGELQYSLPEGIDSEDFLKEYGET